MTQLSPELALVDGELARRARALLPARPEHALRAPAAETTRVEEDRGQPVSARGARFNLSAALTSAVSVAAAVLLFLPAGDSARPRESAGTAGEALTHAAQAARVETSRAQAATTADSTHQGPVARSPSDQSRTEKSSSQRESLRSATEPSAATDNSAKDPAAEATAGTSAATSNAWIGWQRARRASFYNVVLTGNGKRVNVWPSTNTLSLGAAGSSSRATARVAPGTYSWFVYPGFRENGAVRYGPLLAHGTVRVSAHTRSGS